MTIGLQEVRRSPVVVWDELRAAVEARRGVQAQIDADLATMSADPGEDEIDAHEDRCCLPYAQLEGASELVAELAQELDDLGLVGEIGRYLAVTYGGRP